MIVFRIVVAVSLAFAGSCSAAGASSLASDTPAEPPPSGTAAGWLHIPGGSRARYTREIREISDRHGLSTALVEAVIHAESAFNAQAVSRKGAQRLMQLMPQTASALGVQNAFDRDRTSRAPSAISAICTDDLGGDAMNLRLSQERSFRVLVRGLEVLRAAAPADHDCFAALASASGRGKQDLIYDAAHQPDRELSRRVVFKLLFRRAFAD